jgi:hypothetical protein
MESRLQVLIVYAAWSGFAAYQDQGGGRNSFFTAALLEQLPRVGHLGTMRLVEEVRASVIADTRHAQNVWISGSLSDHSPRLVPPSYVSPAIQTIGTGRGPLGTLRRRRVGINSEVEAEVAELAADQARSAVPPSRARVPRRPWWTALVRRSDVRVIGACLLAALVASCMLDLLPWAALVIRGPRTLESWSGT